MANFITIFRIFIAFIAIYLLFVGNFYGCVWAFGLTALAFALDGVDGYVARKFNESSKLGAMLDIMSDRIVENAFWITFATLGWLPIAFPLIALTRGFITDGLRSVGMEQGYTAFGTTSMQDSNLGHFICCSKFSRAAYAVSKLVAFLFMILAHIPGIKANLADSFGIFAIIFAIIAMEFCVIRGLPVLFASKKFFVPVEEKNVVCQTCNV